VQDKFWVEGGTHKFEVYTVLADADVMKNTPVAAGAGAATSSATANAAKSAEVCCAPQAQTVAFK
jgi:hypothetical protein